MSKTRTKRCHSIHKKGGEASVEDISTKLIEDISKKIEPSINAMNEKTEKILNKYISPYLEKNIAVVAQSARGTVLSVIEAIPGLGFLIAPYDLLMTGLNTAKSVKGYLEQYQNMIEMSELDKIIIELEIKIAIANAKIENPEANLPSTDEIIEKLTGKIFKEAKQKFDDTLVKLFYDPLTKLGQAVPGLEFLLAGKELMKGGGKRGGQMNGPENRILASRIAFHHTNRL